MSIQQTVLVLEPKSLRGVELLLELPPVSCLGSGKPGRWISQVQGDRSPQPPGKDQSLGTPEGSLTQITEEQCGFGPDHGTVD